jgi:trimeric autotransporter adhesin
MKTHVHLNIWQIVTVTVLVLGLGGVAAAQGPDPQGPTEAQTALGTTFTYQGQLKNASGPVNGTCDFQFSLWDSLSNATGQIGATLSKPGVSVTNGMFAVQLDFGNVFTGEARWLQIAAKCAGDANYSTLAPRQALTPTPYALALPGLWTQQNATSPNLVGGYAGNSITPTAVGATIAGGGYLGSGHVNRVTSNYGTVGGGFGNTAGNVSTVSGGYSNDASGFAATVSGGRANTASINYATASGGDANRASGYASTIGGGYGNRVSGDYATIGGGRSISVSGEYAAVAGGSWITATGDYAAVGGGVNNTASGLWSSIGGGTYNVANENATTVSGGWHNTANSNAATVGGGSVNTANGWYATVGGGVNNQASGMAAAISGGEHITATGGHATAGGGFGNNIAADYATIAGGQNNTARGYAAALGGGSSNTINDYYATINGGLQNTVSGYAASIGGGAQNRSDNHYATVSGGQGNGASGYGAVIGGGILNVAGNYNYPTVGGGHYNVAGGDSATVSGGKENAITAAYGTIAGGDNNSVLGSYATIGGGEHNIARGYAAIVPGGYYNEANGDYSTAAGTQAYADYEGCYVWSDNSWHPWDDTTTQAHCMADMSWVVRASGGVFFYTDAAMHVGAALSPGSGTWSTSSDRNLKQNFVLVEGREILARLEQVPVTTWNYKSQDKSIRHMGPVAQDFYAAFKLGEDDLHIGTADADGVALAAIQGLYQVVQEKDREILSLKSQMSQQQVELVQLSTRLEALERQADNTSASGSVPSSWLLVVGGLFALGAVYMQRRRAGGRQ